MTAQLLIDDIRAAHAAGFGLLIAPDKTTLIGPPLIDLATLGADGLWHLTTGGSHARLTDAIAAVRARAPIDNDLPYAQSALGH